MFQNSWTENRPWLTYDKSSDKMFCVWHRDADSAVTTGCSNVKMDAVKHHETSKAHKSLAPHHVNLPDSGVSKAVKCLKIIKQADLDKLLFKFRTAHVIMKHHKRFKDFAFLCKLDQVKGLDLGKLYLND